MLYHYIYGENMSEPKFEEDKFKEILRDVIEYHDLVGDDIGELTEKLSKHFRIPREVIEKILNWCSEVNGCFEECVAEGILEEIAGK